LDKNAYIKTIESKEKEMSKEDKIKALRLGARIMKISLDKLSNRSCSLLIDLVSNLNEKGKDLDLMDISGIIAAQDEAERIAKANETTKSK